MFVVSGFEMVECVSDGIRTGTLPSFGAMDAERSGPVDEASKALTAAGSHSPLSPPELADSLASDRTKRNVERWAGLMAREGIDFEAFFDEMRRRKLPVKWYMTWMLSRFVERNRPGGARAQRLIWQMLGDCENASMRRELWRALSFIEIDDDIAGEVFDAAIEITASPRQPIAVRAHAIFTARNIALPYAELRRELRLTLETTGREESPGIRARSRNVLRELRKADATSALDRHP